MSFFYTLVEINIIYMSEPKPKQPPKQQRPKPQTGSPNDKDSRPRK